MLLWGFLQRKQTCMLLSHIAQKSTMAEGLCNSDSVQNVAWITDHCVETNYNEPCENAFQLTRQHNDGGIFSFWRDEWEADQQPAETSSCFSTHPRKRIGRNGVSSSLAPSARQINCRKLPTKSKSAILVTFYSHADNNFWRNAGVTSMWAQLSF